jgi:hypothetical protein
VEGSIRGCGGRVGGGAPSGEIAGSSGDVSMLRVRPSAERGPRAPKRDLVTYQRDLIPHKKDLVTQKDTKKIYTKEIFPTTPIYRNSYRMKQPWHRHRHPAASCYQVRGLRPHKRARMLRKRALILWYQVRPRSVHSLRVTCYTIQGHIPLRQLGRPFWDSRLPLSFSLAPPLPPPLAHVPSQRQEKGGKCIQKTKMIYINNDVYYRPIREASCRADLD